MTEMPVSAEKCDEDSKEVDRRHTHASSERTAKADYTCTHVVHNPSQVSRCETYDEVDHRDSGNHQQQRNHEDRVGGGVVQLVIVA